MQRSVVLSRRGFSGSRTKNQGDTAGVPITPRDPPNRIPVGTNDIEQLLASSPSHFVVVSRETRLSTQRAPRTARLPRETTLAGVIASSGKSVIEVLGRLSKWWGTPRAVRQQKALRGLPEGCEGDPAGRSKRRPAGMEKGPILGESGPYAGTSWLIPALIHP